MKPTLYPTLIIAVLLAALVLGGCTAQSASPTELPLTLTSAPTNTQPAPTEVLPTSPEATATHVMATDAPATATASGEISFSQDVLPLLKSKCGNCHGDQRSEKKLKLNSYANVMAGSENGAVITPGDAANSILIELVANGKMPKRGGKLTAEQVQMLTNWVNAGANDN